MPQTSLAAPGYFEFNTWGVIEISGPDAADFLNRLTTLNFKKWNSSETRLGAFLTGRSGVVSLGFFQSEGAGFHFCLPLDQMAVALEHIEKFHFAENLQARDCSAEWALFGCWKTGDPAGVGREWPDAFIQGLVWQKVPVVRRADWLTAVQTLPLLSAQAFEVLRTRAGLPRVGKEIDSNTLILEANLERAVDRNKGCYPGQEVVERIFTYGRVNRKLLPVRLTGDWEHATLPLKFVRDGHAAGTLMSAVSSVGLAFIYRQFWEQTEPFTEGTVQMQISRNE